MIAILAMVLLGCSNAPGDTACSPVPGEYPRDATLSFSNIQALGTHNSYHVETTNGQIPEWEYTHAAIGTQLRDQGIRQFELDLYYNEFSGELEVLHVPYLDPGTNCATLADCVREMADFSRENPAHHPLLVLLEFKSNYSEDQGEAWLNRTETVLLSELGDALLLRPSTVRGDNTTLREAIGTNGWPSLAELRGKTLFVLHDSGSLRQHYVDHFNPEEWTLFPDASGNASLDYAAVHAVNDPEGSFELIQSLVSAGQIVRTRADSNLVEGRNQDDSRFQKALASGAHFISTDFPVPQGSIDYTVSIPEGTPSRCNPLWPDPCEATDIEDPRFINTCD